MNKLNNKNKKDKSVDFFGFSEKEKVRIVREANKNANKEQYELIKRHGGASALRQFCN